MKSLIIVLTAMCATVTVVAQNTTNPDTTARQYLTYCCSMHPQYVSNVPGTCPVCNRKMNLSGKEMMKMEMVKLYNCTMDKVISTQPGKCPKCGMDMTRLDVTNKPTHH